MGTYAALAALLLVVPPLAADTLTLRDGTVIHGHFVSGTPQKIIFQDHNGVWRRFDVKQVKGIGFGAGAQHAPASTGSAERAASYIAVRTEEAIDPRDAVAGRTYLATVAEDIRGENGTVVIPGGSAARIMVRPMAGAGAVKYQVELESVVIDGSRYVVYGDAVAVGPRRPERKETDPGSDAPALSVSGAHISVPADTVLEFRMEQPLLLRQAGD